MYLQEYFTHECLFSFQGDAGGPLVCRVNGHYELVGVTSWVPKGCLIDYPAVYSRIAFFREWIKEKTGL